MPEAGELSAAARPVADAATAAALRLETEWRLYVHTHSISSNYGSAYECIATIRTVADLWRTLQNVPDAAELVSKLVLHKNKRVVAYSLFRGDVRPEWEHNVNSNGSEWGCRDAIHPETLTRMWLHLALAAVGEQLRHCVGARVINKSNRTRQLHKVEVWMSTMTPSCTAETLADVRRTLEGTKHPEFSLMNHSQKKTQAHDYETCMRKKRQQHAGGVL